MQELQASWELEQLRNEFQDREQGKQAEIDALKKKVVAFEAERALWTMEGYNFRF